MNGRDKVMIVQPHQPELGSCGCGHTIHPGEIVMGYKHEGSEYWYVCLTCHFWYVHSEAEATA